MIQLNLKGSYFFNTAVATQSMLPRKKGATFNIASASALVGVQGQSVYSTTKAAEIQFTKVLAPLLANKELSDTQIKNIPMHRFGSVDEVAQAVCFLVSDAAAFITGVVLPIDGGLTLL